MGSQKREADTDTDSDIPLDPQILRQICDVTMDDQMEDFNVTTYVNDTRIKPPSFVELLQSSSWSFGTAQFWLLVGFGPLIACFIISYIVHWMHVLKLVELRKMEMANGHPPKVSAMFSMRELERQNTTFLGLMDEEADAHDFKHSESRKVYHSP